MKKIIKLNKKYVGTTLFITMLLTYLYHSYGENTVTYGFPYGYITIYPEATTLISSFNLNIFLLLINILLIGLSLWLINIIKNKIRR